MTSIQLIVDRQLRRWEAERLAALEAARAGRSVRETAPARPTVTVSRQEGLRGEAIAQALAARLGYELFDRQIIEYIATHHDVHRQMLEMLDERTISSIKLWAEGIAYNFQYPRGGKDKSYDLFHVFPLPLSESARQAR